MRSLYSFALAITISSACLAQPWELGASAFGAGKAWTAWAIASNEIESRHRVDLDGTITAKAETAKDMNSKYKKTSQAGLALSVTLC